jgi:hypothetical protein
LELLVWTIALGGVRGNFLGDFEPGGSGTPVVLVERFLEGIGFSDQLVDCAIRVIKGC